MKNKLRVLLVGFYDGHNRGDEAILRAVVQQIKALATEQISFTLTVLSGNPPLVKQQQPAIDSVLHLRKPWQVIKALWQCDMVVFGGGAMLFDFSVWDSLKLRGKSPVLFWLAVSFAAKCLGKQLYWLGIGAGPFYTRLSKVLLRIIAPVVDYITLRDEYSCRLLQQICHNRLKRIQTTADWAFLLPPPKSTRQTYAGEPYIVLVPANIHDFGNQATRFFDQIKGKLSTKCLIMPTHSIKDKSLFNDRSNVVWIDKLDEYMELLRGAQAVVSMRMHPIILASILGVPALAVKSYDPKLESIARLTNPGIGWVSLDQPDTAIRRIEQILSNRDVFAAELSRSVKSLRHKALVNIAPVCRKNRLTPPALPA